MIEKIILCGITVSPPHKEILKTAIGATASVLWEYEEETLAVIERLKQENYQIIAIEQTDQSVQLNDFNVDNNSKYVLIFGNEVKGVSTEVLLNSDVAIEIPQYGTKHSLNVSVCGGIVLWHFASAYL